MRLRIDRRLGEMLARTIEHGGDRRSDSRSHDATLKDCGISKTQSSRWQRLADVPAVLDLRNAEIQLYAHREGAK